MKNFFVKFKNIIINFAKGIAIGIAMIIPGVSGGTLAVLLDVYDEIIEAVNHLFKSFGKSIKTLLPILVGALVGFLGLVIPLKYGLANCPLIIVSLFAGLIIGGLPTLYRKVQGKISVNGGIVFFISLAFMIGICFLVSIFTFDLTNLNFSVWMYLFLAGVIIAMALVMPGISGSMMLMVLGLYVSVLNCFSDLLHFKNIGYNISILIPIALGAIIGFFVISYIMGKLLKKHETGTYFCILGLVIGSIGTIYYLVFSSPDKYPVSLSALEISLSIILFIVGFALTFLLDHFVNRNKKEKLEGSKNEIR